MPGMQVLPEVRIFQRPRTGYRRAADRSPGAKVTNCSTTARVGRRGRAAIRRQQPFKGIGEIDNMLFAAAPVVRAKMVIANKRERWAGRLLILQHRHPGADADRGYYRWHPANGWCVYPQYADIVQQRGAKWSADARQAVPAFAPASARLRPFVAYAGAVQG